MSDIKLNLLDSQQLIKGKVHFGVADRCVAALSVEPETFNELTIGLSRFQKIDEDFFWSTNFTRSEPQHDLIDLEACDAGLLVIDLVARAVVYQTEHFEIHRKGLIEYHDGNEVTELLLPFWLADDWLITESLAEYFSVREARCQHRAMNPPLDIRPILYGRPMLEFIVENSLQFSARDAEILNNCGEDCDPLSGTVTAVHALWLMTKRQDLNDQSPRDVMLARQDLVNFDLHSRCLQWSFQLIGPPCVPRESNAYKYAGVGTHEWVIYYDLVRHLIWRALAEIRKRNFNISCDPQKLIDQLEEIKTSWLTEPNPEMSDRIPFIMIDNERKRLPEAMGGRSMVIDEDCPICRAMGDETEAGLGIWFYHLDECNMDEGFAFSSCRTVEEWEAQQKELEEMHLEFEQGMKEQTEQQTSSLLIDEPFVFVGIDKEIPDA